MAKISRMEHYWQAFDFLDRWSAGTPNVETVVGLILEYGDTNIFNHIPFRNERMSAEQYCELMGYGKRLLNVARKFERDWHKREQGSIEDYFTDKLDARAIKQLPLFA